jgi:hypothetical protein
MFEYKFVTVPSDPPRIAGRSRNSVSTPYETVIREQAEQGWRLVQIFVANPAASPSEYVLIFERTKPNFE